MLFLFVLLRNAIKLWDRFNVGDDLNLAQHIIYGTLKKETYFIKLCRRWFNPYLAFKWYFRKRAIWNARMQNTLSPPIDESYKEILIDVFGERI